MAINPIAMKTLFGKLVPYADDVAKGVANYGDDAARIAANYGDDALAAVDKLDDLPFVGTLPDVRRTVQDVNIEPYFDMFEQPSYLRNGVRIDDRWFTDPNPRISKLYLDYLDDLAFYAEDDPFEEVLQRKGLTHANTKANILDRMVRGNRSYDAPTRTYNLEHGNGVDHPLGYGGQRPHANTAIGKWWKKHYRDGAKYLDPIGPLQNILPDQELPF